MTSEVVLLNKDAIVIAADSAVTVGRDPHPRYSKSANKIFDGSTCGNLAIAIFSGAEIDGVPWELAVKQFRAADSTTPQRPTVKDYVPALIQFLQCNPSMFPAEWLEQRLKDKLAIAAMQVADDAKKRNSSLEDVNLTQEIGLPLWQQVIAELRQAVDALPLAGGLSTGNYQAIKGRMDELAPLLQDHAPAGVRPFIDLTEYCELAIDYAFKAPHYVYSSTGVIFAGYGAAQIFPAFHSITVYGHIGSEVCFVDDAGHVIDHTIGAWIQPFAKTSMIQRFTDGFDYKQQSLLNEAIASSIAAYTQRLRDEGAQIEPQLAATLTHEITEASVHKWKMSNYAENFHPLRRVLNSLSVQEMAELAETLLVLESLRERVTSPSETVGGPVDVAAITKADGLVWIRRKHYFEPKLNLRYLERIKST
jgi:hypothetical protein